jgi:hypothetical protein
MLALEEYTGTPSLLNIFESIVQSLFCIVMTYNDMITKLDPRSLQILSYDQAIVPSLSVAPSLDGRFQGSHTNKQDKQITSSTDTRSCLLRQQQPSCLSLLPSKTCKAGPSTPLRSLSTATTTLAPQLATTISYAFIVITPLRREPWSS